MKSEFDLIDLIAKKSKSSDVIRGIGDDCAVIASGSKYLLYSTDSLVENVHFTRKWFSTAQIASKFVHSNVSDIFAMGGTPKHMLISLQLTARESPSLVKELYKHLRSELAKFKVELVGGNISSSSNFSLTCTIIGEVTKRDLCLRSHAKPGDYLLINKPIGKSRIGYELLKRKISGFSEIKNSFLSPKTKPVVSARHVNAMIDISDGLLSDLSHICKQSNVGATIHINKIPVTKLVRDSAIALNEDLMDLVLNSGEEYAMLYTVPKKQIDKVQGFVIGEITKKKEIVTSTGKRLRPKGYDHLLKRSRT